MQEHHQLTCYGKQQPCSSPSCLRGTQDVSPTVGGPSLVRATTAKMDSDRTAELSPEKARHIYYGYAVDGLKNIRAERVIATGDGLTQETFQAISTEVDLALYTSSPQQDLASSQEIAAPELAQPAKQQSDFGIGF
jgi:hypothetical protein